MTEKHPITPPPELVQQWVDTYFGGRISQSNFHVDLAARAAQWGSDQELEACCEWIKDYPWAEHVNRHLLIEVFRAARRPKPPSLKEQALQELEQLRGDANSMGMGFDAPAILRALEQLDD